MSITSLGVGSGLDLESLVSSLVTSEKTAKLSSYNTRKSDLKVELSAISAIKSKISTFQSTIEKLNTLSDFQQRTTSVKQPDSGNIISMSATEDAAPGSYNVSVESIAQGSRSMSQAGAFATSDDIVSAAGGNLTFTAGTETFTMAVDPNMTLSQLREAINDDANNFGVTANLIDTGSDVRLVLTSDVTGTGNDLVVTNDDASLDAVSTNMAIGANDNASSARIWVDGLQVDSDTNTFENVISGVTIKALAESNGDTAKASVETDKEAVRELLNGFVTSYNEIMDLFDEATQAGAALNGDSFIRNTESQLARTIMTQFTNTGDFQTIFDLGIKMDNSSKLSIDSGALDEAMESGYDDIAQMFAGTDGIASLLDNMLEPYVQSAGILDKRKDSIQEQIDTTQESIDAFNYRMEQYELTLRKQFGAMDTAVASLSSQGAYLSAQLSSLPGFSSSKS
jgi:flagellar hook-associated protein 2